MCSTNEPKVRGLTSATRKAGSTVREACSMKVAPGGTQEKGGGRAHLRLPTVNPPRQYRDQGTRDDQGEQRVGAGLDQRALVPGLQADGEREQLVVVQHHQRQEE